MDGGCELRGLMTSLAREEGVFGSVASEADGLVAEQVRRLVVEAEHAWARYVIPGASGPDSSAEVAEVLREVDCEHAVELMTYLAVEDLVFPER